MLTLEMVDLDRCGREHVVFAIACLMSVEITSHTHGSSRRDHY